MDMIMGALRSIYHLMRADLLERLRQYSFMVVMVMTVFAGYLLVPPIGAAYTSFVIGSHRGFYNSPWVGTLFGVVACTLLALVGFYLVKNAVQRDGRTRVGQIIATTPVRKPFYTLGKWLSNVTVFALILAVLTGIAPIMQYVRAEDAHIDFWALAAPIWIMGLPALALVAALAVLFECVPFLRGGLGNVVYFFLWGPLLIGSTIGSAFSYGSDSAPRNDFAGLSRTLISIHQHLEAGGYDASYGVSGVIGPVMDEKITRFTWDGIQWTSDILLERAIWLAGAAVVALAAAIPFDRFDPARSGLARRLGRKRSKSVPDASGDRTGQDDLPMNIGDPARVWDFTQSEFPGSAFNLRCLWYVMTAEVRLMLKGQHWVWYTASFGLLIACLFSPFHIVRGYLLPIAWAWPVLVWSQMGARQERYGTWQMIFSASRPISRQLPAAWLAGVAIAAVTGGGAAIRFFSAGAWMSLFAWAVGALFIPALALMLGTLTATRRAFEMLYLLWWYLAFNGVIPLDFIGITQEALNKGYPWLYLGLALVFLGASLVGRWRRLRG